ncbi:MAG: hypothetical protein GDA46_04210 [Bdellovibrionales bacterium]|nr:hypothetical protein [Bdellovibrionales bacterium]
MAELIFSKIDKGYKKYRKWLKMNSYLNFHEYSWVIAQMALSIDHRSCFFLKLLDKE